MSPPCPDHHPRRTRRAVRDAALAVHAAGRAPPRTARCPTSACCARCCSTSTSSPSSCTTPRKASCCSRKLRARCPELAAGARPARPRPRARREGDPRPRARPAGLRGARRAAPRGLRAGGGALHRLLPEPHARRGDTRCCRCRQAPRPRDDWAELDAAFLANRDPLTGHEPTDLYRPLFTQDRAERAGADRPGAGAELARRLPAGGAASDWPAVAGTRAAALTAGHDPRRRPRRTHAAADRPHAQAAAARCAASR